MNDEIDNIEDEEINDESERTAKVRQRIDDLLERKRLKELLDATDDWEL